MTGVTADLFSLNPILFKDLDAHKTVPECHAFTGAIVGSHWARCHADVYATEMLPRSHASLWFP